MKRVIIFIDGSNLYHGLKETMVEFELDFEKFANYLCGSDRQLVNLYYYNAPLKKQHGEEEYKAQQRFFSYLKRLPNFILRLGRLETRNSSFTLWEILNGFNHSLVKEIVDKVGKKRLKKVKSEINWLVEKGVDVNLAVEMVALAYNNAYDVAILVSGDGDFAVAVRYVQGMKKKVEVSYFPDRPCWHLKKVCDKFIPLTPNILNKLKKLE